MKIDFGQASQVLANIGVMLGLAFLAIEIGQNQESLEEQNVLTTLAARDTALEHYSQFRLFLLANPELFQLWEKGQRDQPLTDLESQQFATLCLEEIYLNLSVFNRFSALGQTLEVRELVGRLARGLKASERRFACWAAQRETVSARGHAAFVNAVEQAIERP